MWLDYSKRMWTLLCSAVTEQEGVTAIEYGLLAGLIAVVCVAAFAATGGSLAAVYTAWSAAVVAAL
jgi:pilus assembly protein Flp/PilA